MANLRPFLNEILTDDLEQLVKQKFYQSSALNRGFVYRDHRQNTIYPYTEYFRRG
jgi:hypothetical protein